MLHRIISLLLLLAIAICSSASPLAVHKNTSDSAISERSAFTGRGTWYNPGLDACGATDAASSSVVALSLSLFESSNYCGKKIQISYGGKTATAEIHDACEGCGYYDIDMSPTVFSQLADLSVGEMQVSWTFI